MGRLATALVAAAASFGGPARAQSVALTFDDLPVAGRTTGVEDREAITRRLLAGLKRARLPATGFVNEVKLEGPDRAREAALLGAWLDAGEELGNHGYAHRSLTTTPVDAYDADIARGEAVTRPMLAARGRTERWFRPPYLETGPTPAARRTFEAWLASHGYRLAPVTMENADWMFAAVYDDAVLRGDQAGAARVRAAYLAHTAAVVPWYRDAATALLGRPIAFVFLLHASRLNADSVGPLAAILRRAGLRATTLDRAIADPAYALSDDYAGPNGDQWLTRWARTLHRDLPWATLPQPPAWVAQEEARLDAAPPVVPPPTPSPAR